MAERDVRPRATDRGGARRRGRRQAQPARRQPTAYRHRRRQGQPLRGRADGGDGLFRPADRENGIWDGLPPLLRITEPLGDGQPLIVVGVVAQSALNKRAAEGWPIQTTWRYRLGVDGIDARELDQTIDGLTVMQRNRPQDLTLVQGVDVPLRAFAAQVDAARTLLAVIAAGVLATLTGLIVLAASLAIRRRRSEFELLRARGAATAGARRSLAESVLVVPVAAALGWWLGTLFPGEPDPTTPYVVAATVLVTLALPVATLAVPAGGRPAVTWSGCARRPVGSPSRFPCCSWPGSPRYCCVDAASPSAMWTRCSCRCRCCSRSRRRCSRCGRTLAVVAGQPAGRADPGQRHLPRHGACRALGGRRPARRRGAGDRHRGLLRGRRRRSRREPGAGGGAGRARRRGDPWGTLRTRHRRRTGSPAGVRAVTRVLYETDERLAADELGTDARVGQTAVLLVDGSGLDTVARASEVDLSVPAALLGARPGAGRCRRSSHRRSPPTWPRPDWTTRPSSRCRASGTSSGWPAPRRASRCCRRTPAGS
ncbi:hypothetical protein NKG94_23655 [Micromonospora sp. M12]